jgi:hypothetical protein
MNIGTNIVAVMSAQLRVVDRACSYVDLLVCLPKQVAAPAIDITRNSQANSPLGGGGVVSLEGFTGL